MQQSVFLDAMRMVADITEVYGDALCGFKDLNIIDAHVLLALYEQGATRPTELAAHVGRAPMSFSATLDKLERIGLIVRRRYTDPEDRRAVSVELTQTGRDLFPQLLHVLHGAHLIVLGQFLVRDTSARKFVEAYAPDSRSSKGVAKNGGAK